MRTPGTPCPTPTKGFNYRPDHVLHHGDQLRFNASEQSTRLTQLPAEQIAPWRRWQLVAIDQTVDDVITQLRRYQPGLIVLTDNTLGQRRTTTALNLRVHRQRVQPADH